MQRAWWQRSLFQMLNVKGNGKSGVGGVEGTGASSCSPVCILRLLYFVQRTMGTIKDFSALHVCVLFVFVT